mmetsp:Transcript_7441/g.16421  ORF Transcript_7441/g.16421 Transcript_7441/m.16421 type:complete len:220 (-) Transcript_7441:1908-2567(-)
MSSKPAGSLALLSPKSRKQLLQTGVLAFLQDPLQQKKATAARQRITWKASRPKSHQHSGMMVPPATRSGPSGMMMTGSRRIAGGQTMETSGGAGVKPGMILALRGKARATESMTIAGELSAHTHGKEAMLDGSHTIPGQVTPRPGPVGRDVLALVCAARRQALGNSSQGKLPNLPSSPPVAQHQPHSVDRSVRKSGDGDQQSSSRTAAESKACCLGSLP